MRWPIIAAAVLLAGCGFTPQGDAVRAAVKDAGAQAFDEGLANSEFFLCQAASIGSVKRRYGQSSEMAAAYNELCAQAGGELIVTGPAE